MGARNPSTGEIEGFDIDLAKAIGTAIMGDPSRITFKAVPTAERVEFLQDGKVDMIVRTMTITCDRLGQVAFSKPYFKTSNRLLVPKAAGVKTFDEALKGRTSCAARSSSAEDELKANPRGSTLVSVENQLDCLVLMQLGKVDATMTDDGLAAGQAAQDTTVTMLDERVRPGYMGVAMKLGNDDLVARVNQVLADYQASGGGGPPTTSGSSPPCTTTPTSSGREAPACGTLTEHRWPSERRERTWRWQDLPVRR